MKKMPLLLLALSMPLILTGCFRTRADIAKENEAKEMKTVLQQNVVEHSQNFDRMQADIGRLQGKVEEIEHQRRKEMSSFSSSHEGNAKAVAELKGRLEEMQKSQAMLFEEIKKLREENVQMLKSLSRPQAAPQNSPRSGSGTQKKKEPAASYESAMTAFKAKDYEAALAGFRAYLQENPKSKRLTSTRYHIAESLFHQKAFADAIVEFAVIHERSPASALGRKSTLKIAESFKALGKDKDAKAFAQILVQGSPESAEAKQARKFLR